jgi:hypothetical protein
VKFSHLKTHLKKRQMNVQECQDKLLQFEITRECIKPLLLKLVSIGIVTGSSIVKVPQIIKMTKSVQGISITSTLLESLSLAITLTYNFRNENPFTTYGETLFLLLQNIIILQFFGFKNVGLILLIVLLLSQASIQILTTLVTLTIALTLLSKVPQILLQFREKSGLSIITVTMQTLGTFARIFTTLGLKDDVLLLVAVVSFVLNLIIFIQVLFSIGSDSKGKTNTFKGKTAASRLKKE